MTQFWTITAVSDGTVLSPCFATPSAEVHPKDCGWAWDAAAHKASPIAAAPDPAVQNWSGKTWGEAASKIEHILCDLVDDEREARQMLSLTPGGAKKYVYNRKAQEAINAQGILASVLNALSLVEKKKKYPFAYAESAVTGEPLTAVLARFETGMTVAAAENARIEAVAMKAKRDIRAATTAAQKRAVYAAIIWNVVVP